MDLIKWCGRNQGTIVKNEKNKLIILASHNREDIDVLCDEVYEMEDGVLRKIQM